MCVRRAGKFVFLFADADTVYAVVGSVIWSDFEIQLIQEITLFLKFHQKRYCSVPSKEKKEACPFPCCDHIALPDTFA